MIKSLSAIAGPDAGEGLGGRAGIGTSGSGDVGGVVVNGTRIGVGIGVGVGDGEATATGLAADLSDALGWPELCPTAAPAKIKTASAVVAPATINEELILEKA